MRWNVLLLIVVSGMGCNVGQSPAGETSSASRDRSAAAGRDAQPGSGSLAVAVTASPALGRAETDDPSSHRPHGQEPPEPEPKGGAGEPTGDVDGAVPVTDGSGAAAPASEPERFEGIEVELEE